MKEHRKERGGLDTMKSNLLLLIVMAPIWYIAYSIAGVIPAFFVVLILSFVWGVIEKAIEKPKA